MFLWKNKNVPTSIKVDTKTARLTRKFFTFWINSLRSSVVQTWMNALAAIPRFNVFKNRVVSGFWIFLFPKVYRFLFQDRMKWFDASIVVRASFSTVGMADFQFSQSRFKKIARILTSQIRLNNYSLGMLYIQDCILQCLECKLCIHDFAKCPADYFSQIQIFN